jgi:hypothetical protein
MSGLVCLRHSRRSESIFQLGQQRNRVHPLGLRAEYRQTANFAFARGKLPDCRHTCSNYNCPLTPTRN